MIFSKISAVILFILCSLSPLGVLAQGSPVPITAQNKNQFRSIGADFVCHIDLLSHRGRLGKLERRNSHLSCGARFIPIQVRNQRNRLLQKLSDLRATRTKESRISVMALSLSNLNKAARECQKRLLPSCLDTDKKLICRKGCPTNCEKDDSCSATNGSPTATPTAGATITRTPTPTSTPRNPGGTATTTPTATSTRVASPTTSPSPTPTATATGTNTSVPTQTPTRTATPTRSATSSPTSTPTPTPVTSPAGWTQITPQPDSRLVYVSTSDGDDSYSGLSESRPKKTIASARQLMRDFSPDWMLLKRGDTFPTGLGHWLTEGRSADAPQVITSYGTSTERPILNSGLDGGIEFSGGGGARCSYSNVYVLGLSFIANRENELNSNFTQSAAVSFLRGGQNVLVEGCYMAGYFNNFNIQGNDGLGPCPYEAVRNFRIRRNVAVDSFAREGHGHAQGMYAERLDGLLVEGNVFDHNGWSETVPTAGADIFKHSFYLSIDVQNVTMRENIIARSSSHAISMNGTGIISDNLLPQNAIGVFARTAPSEVSHNVILYARDIDHSTPGLDRSFGILIGSKYDHYTTLGDSIVKNNVIAHRTSFGGNSAIDIGGANPGATPVNRIITGNVVFDWRNTSLEFENNLASSIERITVTGNSFQERTGTSPVIIASTPLSAFSFINFRQNRYFSDAADARWYDHMGTLMNFSSWASLAGESGSNAGQVNFKDPNRDLGTYMQYLGAGTTFEEFMTEARKQSPSYWRPEFTAPVANAYIFDGFGMP